MKLPRILSHPATVRTQAMFAIERGDLTPLAVFICVPALALSLGIAIAWKLPVEGVTAAGAALSVGFGSFQRFTAFRPAPMLLALAGMLISAALGAFFGGDTMLIILLAAGAGASCGIANSLGKGAWWLAVQWTVWLVISAAHPTTSEADFVRGLLCVLAGGLLQIVSVATAWWLTGMSVFHGAEASGDRGDLGGRGGILRFTAASAIAVALATALWQLTGVANGYWMVITTILVLKPVYTDSIERCLSRLSGTVAGGGFATLLAAALRPQEAVIGLIALVFCILSYATQRSGYAAFTASLTGTVAFFLAFVGIPEPEVALHRIIATALGGLIALIVAKILHVLELRLSLRL